MSSDQAIQAFQKAVDGILPEKPNDEQVTVCRRVCSGPLDNMTCVMECIPVRQVTSHNDLGASATGRRHLLLQASLMYLTHLEVGFVWPNLYDYENVLFCIARFINKIASPLEHTHFPMGTDLEQLYALHQCERELGSRNIDDFSTCTLAKLKKMHDIVFDTERETKILIQDFVMEPHKYQMVVSPYHFMQRLENVSLVTLENFARLAWYHPVGHSKLEKHCIGHGQPFVLYGSKIVHGDAFYIPTGIDMEYKIRQAEIDVGLYPPNTKFQAPLGCDFEYVFKTADQELLEKQDVPDSDIFDLGSDDDDATDHIADMLRRAQLMTLDMQRN